MTDYTCNFCSKKFSTITLLKRHQTTVKYCLKIQQNKVNNPNEFICEDCSKKFSTKQNLNTHKLNCKSIRANQIEKLKIENEICAIHQNSV